MWALDEYSIHTFLWNQCQVWRCFQHRVYFLVQHVQHVLQSHSLRQNQPWCLIVQQQKWNHSRGVAMLGLHVNKCFSSSRLRNQSDFHLSAAFISLLCVCVSAHNRMMVIGNKKAKCSYYCSLFWGRHECIDLNPLLIIILIPSEGISLKNCRRLWKKNNIGSQSLRTVIHSFNGLDHKAGLRQMDIAVYEWCPLHNFKEHRLPPTNINNDSVVCNFSKKDKALWHQPNRHDVGTLKLEQPNRIQSLDN